MPGSIFERYGGFAKIRRVVSDFYDLVLDSDLIAHHFESIDMAPLIDHQTRFIASVTGGPASYSDEHLKRVHERFAITRAEFLEMAALLGEALEDNGFAEADVATVINEVRRREPAIVTPGPGA